MIENAAAQGTRFRWFERHPQQHDPGSARTRADAGRRASPGSRRCTSLLSGPADLRHPRQGHSWADDSHRPAACYLQRSGRLGAATDRRHFEAGFLVNWPAPPTAAVLLVPIHGQRYLYGDVCSWKTNMPRRASTMSVDRVQNGPRTWAHWRVSFRALGRPIRVIRMAYQFVPNRPYSVSERAGRKIVEIANSVEAVQDGWIYIELINGPFLYRERGTPEEYKGRPRSSDRARLAVGCTKAAPM